MGMRVVICNRDISSVFHEFVYSSHRPIPRVGEKVYCGQCLSLEVVKVIHDYDDMVVTVYVE